MDQAPIDIQYSELLQWLENRYLIPKDWPKRLELISVKKKEIYDMFFQSESAEMKKLQAAFQYFLSTPLDTLSYLDYSKLNSQLIKTEAAKDKTFLRNYNDPLIYNSYVLNTIYSKSNMNLAEASKIIIQIVTYDIPICKRQIADLNKSIQENKGRSAERGEQIKRNSEKIKSILKSNEIAFDIEAASSNQIASSLIDRLTMNSELENRLEDIEKRIKGNKNIRQAIDMYYDFYKAVNANAGDKDPHLVDCLLRVYTNGDYSLTSGDSQPGDAITKPNRKELIEAKVKRYKLKFSDQGDMKGWNIAIVNDNQSSKTPIASNITDRETGIDSCLLSNKSREILIADLEEVMIFLKERISKADSKDEINLMMYQQAFKDYNYKYTIEDMAENVSAISSLLDSLHLKDLLFLTELYNDEDSIKTITETYSEIKIHNSKLKNMIAELNRKNEEIAMEIQLNEKKVLEYKKIAVGLRKATEIAITKALKRKISIIGDENLI